MSQKEPFASRTAVRTVAEAMDEPDAELMTDRRDGVGRVPLRAPGCHAGRNRREGQAFGGR